MKFFILIIWCLLYNYASAQTTCPTNEPIVACYYASWAVYRTDIGYYNISHINASLCTHVVYTFSGLDINSKITSLDPQFDIIDRGYKRFAELKEQNPCLKTLLAIGGWNEGSRKYSVMASTQESRNAFVESVLKYVVAYDFDGFDFDWEYPTQRGGISEDKANFRLVLQQLRERFSKWNLLLTLAVPISQSVTSQSYDITVIRDYVDFVFLMAYDYTSTTSEKTGLISPLSEIKKTVAYWIANGLPSHKMVLGVPAYARSYTLLDDKKFTIGSPTNGTGVSGPYTNERGFLSYYELVTKLKSNKYKLVREDDNYYAYNDKQWFSFDLEDSYRTKAEYAVSANLGGVMIWSIDTDDFEGKFNSTAYPVLNTVRNVIRKKK